MAIFTTPIARVGDDNFRVGSGYKLHFYAAGTSTDKDTYTDNTYTTASSNPVVADGNGRFAVIWTSGDYKVVLKTDADVTVWTVDNYTTDNASATYAEGVLSASGSAANVITADLPTAPSSLTDQQQVVVELQHGANTIGNPTFNLNSLGAKVIKRDNVKPLRGGDTGGSGNKIYLSYSAANDVWELLNPSMPVLGLGLEWKRGLAVTNNSGTPDEIMDIAVGQILDSTEVAILDLKSAFTKTIASTFAVGTGNGGFSDASESGSGVQASSWYGLFMIGKADGTVDFIFAETQAHALADTVAAAASFIYARLIGYAYSDSSSDILPYLDGGNGMINWQVQQDAGMTKSTTIRNETVRVPPFQQANLATGLRAAPGVTLQALFTQQGATDSTPSTNLCTVENATDAASTTASSSTAIFSLKVNASSQVQHKESLAGASVSHIGLRALGYTMDYTIMDLV